MDLSFKIYLPTLEAPEDTPFIVTVRNKFVREAPSLKSPVIALLCRPGLAVGTAVTELENLNELGGTGSGVAGAKWHHLMQGGYHKGQQSQISNQNKQTHTDLWCWLVDCDAPRRQKDRTLTKFLFHLY